jgi:hypothetical protein
MSSEGTFSKQTQRLFDHGTRAAGYPPPSVHPNRYRSLFAHLAPVERTHAQLPHRALQPHEGHHSVLAPREAPEPNRIQKRATGTSTRFLKIPILPHLFIIQKIKLVLASFPPPGPSTPPHLTLVMKTFQTLFPPLAPHKLALSSARRVVLVAYNAERGTIDWRHFRITVKPYGVSRRVRRVLQGSSATGAGVSAMLDLGNEKDVADYVLRARSGTTDGYESAATSDVSSAAEDEADVVSLAEDYVGRNNRKGQKRAVRLDEIGPRMELRLVKITEGIPGRESAVIYHEFGESFVVWSGVVR